MYRAYNPNPMKSRVGDCTIRAISKAAGQSWETTYAGLCLSGFALCDMPSANHVWGAYLRRLGFRPVLFRVAGTGVEGRFLVGIFRIVSPKNVINGNAIKRSKSNKNLVGRFP